MDHLADNLCRDRQVSSRSRLGRFVYSSVKLLSLLCLAWLLLACSSSEHAEWVRHDSWSARTRFVEWPDVKHRGLAVGFVQPEQRDVPPYQRPSTHKFQIQVGESFTTLLILATGYSEPYPVLVSVFLDYKQIRFTLDGRQGLLHHLEIEPGVDMEIPLEVSIETPGWHDFFVIVFPKPDYHPINPQERLPPKLAAGGRRTVVCAGDCTVSAQMLPEALVGRGTDVHNFNAYAFPLLPDDGRPPAQRLLLSTSVSSGEAFAVELCARNPVNRLRDYTVLPLLDFKQIAFAGFNVLHLHMPPNSELSIPGQVRLPEEDGVHELAFVYIFDPYQELDEVSDPFVQSVMRSALVVEDDGGARLPVFP
jgi:hypothetical protein